MKLTTLAAVVVGSLLFTLHTNGTEISQEEARSIPSMDLEKLEEKEPTLAGKIVRLKFNYRSGDVTKKDDGSMTGRISFWKNNSGFSAYNYKSGHRRVGIPAEGVDWFLKQPTKESRASLLVYARIPESTKEPVVLLGREIKTDLKGSRIVW